MTFPCGRLAIWNTCLAGKETEYEEWYQTEHLVERLSVPGFQRGRRYESVEDVNRYFTYYETDDADVLTSDAYLQRVNHPTSMTTLVMREAFTDMSRTICDVAYSIGRLRGAFAATLKMQNLPDKNWLQNWVTSSPQITSIARVEGWQAADDNLLESAEARLRGGDDKIDACLLVETLREKECRVLMGDLAEKFNVGEEQTDLHRLLCEINSD